MHFQCNVWIYVFDKHTFLAFVTVLNRIFSKTEDGLVLATKNDQNKDQKNQLKAVKETREEPKIGICCHWILD